MPANKKPRKRYRPLRERIVDPIGWVKEGLKPLTHHESYLLDLEIANHGSMTSLLRGTALPRDVTNLIAMSNIVEALQQMGFGKEYADVAVEGRFAILKICMRAQVINKYTPTGEEIGMLNRLMELHDAQLAVITVTDMEKAIVRAQRQLKDPSKAIKLPPIPPELLKKEKEAYAAED